MFQRALLLGTVTAILLAIAQRAECGIIVFDVNGTTADVGSDGTTDFSFIIDLVGLENDILVVNDDVLLPGLGSSDPARRAWREGDAVTSSPTPSTPLGGAALYLDINATIVATPGGVPTFNGGFLAGNDNFVGLRFTDANINGGSAVFGFVQVFADNLPGDAHSIVRVIYDDMGSAITLTEATDATNGGPPGSPVPEPSSIALLGMGGLTLLGYGWRRKRKTELSA